MVDCLLRHTEGWRNLHGKAGLRNLHGKAGLRSQVDHFGDLTEMVDDVRRGGSGASR